MGNEKGVRLDKWLWASRFFKTRALAKKACESGHITYDGRRGKPSTQVQEEATIEIRKGELQWTIVVQKVLAQRRPASEAQSMYRETEASKAAREELLRLRSEQAKMDDYHRFAQRMKKPNKKDRRLLRKMRGK